MRGFPPTVKKSLYKANQETKERKIIKKITTEYLSMKQFAEVIYFHLMDNHMANSQRKNCLTASIVGCTPSKINLFLTVQMYSTPSVHERTQFAAFQKIKQFNFD